jgi:hypothetical protein
VRSYGFRCRSRPRSWRYRGSGPAAGARCEEWLCVESNKDVLLRALKDVCAYGEIA